MIDRLVALRAELELPPLARGELVDRNILDRLDDGIEVESLMLVLDLRANQLRSKPRSDRSWEYFNAVAPFTGPSGGRPGGWAMSRGMLDRHEATRGRVGNDSVGERPAWAELDLEGPARETAALLERQAARR